MLKTLTEEQKLNWKEALNKLVFAYNCTKSEVTGFSPFYLMFGRSPRLPVDALFDLNPDKGSIDHSEYVERWTKGMQEAYEIAGKHAKKCTDRNKRNYDQKNTYLLQNDTYLLKNDTYLLRNIAYLNNTYLFKNEVYMNKTCLNSTYLLKNDNYLINIYQNITYLCRGIL
ncbi:Retrovirus-related Pol polyprotein from transposon 412 [Labeo rohita]|uniref:Retrovirus-related Pol polyprotein from transposon 412 n=1 Tax=Labeo rohita TaxID=84645 RepID=A0A498M4X4_LABRO|nr:Retrovirus-related Pol polyprotein from transposon 412 [Labeo rohita]